MKNVILLTLLFAFSSTTFALEKNTQYWGSLSLIKPLDEKWVTSLEAIERYSVDNGESVVKSFRLGLGYKFENGITYTAIIEDRRTNRHDNNEKRWIHQFSKKWKFESVDLSLRYRQEHRKFEDSEAWMNRSRLKADIDLNMWAFGSFTPYVSSEYMYISNTVEDRQAGTGESRVNLGMDWQATEKLGLDLSYMDRRIYDPRTSVSPRTETLYQVALLSAKYTF